MTSTGSWYLMTQGEQIDAVREYLRAHRGVVRDTLFDGRTFRRLIELVRCHPAAEEKLAGGVSAFHIRNDWRGNIALYIERHDGTEVDVSWRKCVTQHDAGPRHRLLQAMRQAVVDQIIEAIALWELTEPPCPMCGKPIERREAHVDHEVPFNALARRFLALHADTPTEFGEDARTHQCRFLPRDDDFARAWRAFHADHCMLRVTHSQCNLRRKRSA